MGLYEGIPLTKRGAGYTFVLPDKITLFKHAIATVSRTPEELFERPEHTFVGYFIGSPGMNLLEARVEGGRAVVEGCEVALDGDYGQPSGRVEIGVRPEFATLTTGSAGLPVRVRRVEDVGRHKIVRAEFFGSEINVIAGEGDEIGTDMTRVAFDAERVNVYADDWRVKPEVAA